MLSCRWHRSNAKVHGITWWHLPRTLHKEEWRVCWCFTSRSNGQVECDPVLSRWPLCTPTYLWSAKAREGTQAIPSYTAVMSQLAFGFYFPPEVEVKPPPEARASLSFAGSILLEYNPRAPRPKAYSRPHHDFFRPPYRPPVFYPVSIGYGNEVDLLPGQQALWVPNLNTYYLVEHIRQATFYKDPRPAKVLYRTVKKVQRAVDVKERVINLVTEGCKKSQVIEASAKRALSKPHGFVLNAHGVRGRNGANCQIGAAGYRLKTQWSWPTSSAATTWDRGRFLGWRLECRTSPEWHMVMALAQEGR